MTAQTARMAKKGSKREREKLPKGKRKEGDLGKSKRRIEREGIQNKKTEGKVLGWDSQR